MVKSWQKKTINLGSYKVVKITNNLLDLFWGEGWDNQARFKYEKSSKSFLLIGKPTNSLPKDFITILKQSQGEK